MGLLSGNQKLEPMHYGEVFSVWKHLLMAKGCVAKYQFLINHAGDKDLKKYMKNMITKVIRPEIDTLDKLLKENGVMPPPAPQERPEIDGEDIPVGARFSDMEIANCVSHDIALALVECSQIIGLSYREDVALIFAQHHQQLVKQGGQLLKLNKEKGWLVIPPLHAN